MSRSSDERERREIEAFKKRVYQRRNEQGKLVSGINVSSPSLTIERLRRCQNCLHFDREEKFDRHVKHCIRRDAENRRANGFSEEAIAEHLGRLRRTLASGQFGRCELSDRRIDGGEDFTPLAYRCAQWEGRIVVTPQEAAIDLDAAEAYERAGLSVPEHLKK